MGLEGGGHLSQMPHGGSAPAADYCFVLGGVNLLY